MQESPDIGSSMDDVDTISLLAWCKTRQNPSALTYYEGTRDIIREI